MEFGVSLDELISDVDIRVSMKYNNFWVSAASKNRRKLRKYQKMMLDFLQIIGGLLDGSVMT